MRLALVLGFVLTHVVLPVEAQLFAQQPQPTPDQEVTQLIKQLDDRSNATREVAARRLVKIGSPAKPQLLVLLKSSENVEVRARAAQILLELEHRSDRVADKAVQDRVHAFIDNLPGASLPSWQRYTQIVGNDLDSRNFFIDMLRKEPALLAAYDEGPEKAVAEFERYWFLCDLARIGALFPQAAVERIFPVIHARAMQLRSAATTATLLLLASDEKLNLPESQLLRLIDQTSYFDQTAWNNAYQEPLPFRKLLLHWLRLPVGNERTETFKRQLALVSNTGIQRIPEVSDWLLDVAIDPQRSLEHRLDALVAIPRLHNFLQRGRLEALLQDSTLLQDGTPLQDVVLALLVKNSGLTPKDYGFPDNMPELLTTHKFGELTFHKAASREQALDRWRTWSQQDRDWHETVEAFASDRDGSQKRSLPGWERFSKIMGTGPDARTLFAEMQRVDREILALYDQDPTKFKVTDFLKERIANRWTFTTGSLGTFLFVIFDQNLRFSWHFESPLREFISHPDYGYAATAPVLALLAKLQQRNEEADASLNAFAQDVKGVWNLTLPGWRQYRQLVGGTRASRELFVEMQRAEPELLRAYQQGPEAASKQLAHSAQMITIYPHASPVSAFAAMLLVLSDKQVKASPATVATICQPLGYLRYNLNQVPFGDQAVPKLLANWVQLPSADDQIEVDKQKLALTYQLRQTTPYFLAQATNPKLKAEARIRALLTLTILADEKQVSGIEPLLQENAVYEQDKKSLQLRDLALAILVYRSKQSLPEYGFQPNQNNQLFDTLDAYRLQENPAELLYFDLADRRQAALDKWKAWSQQQQVLQAQLAAFSEGTKKVELPGWPQYRDIVGDTPGSRSLFREMQEASPALLGAYARTPAEAVKVLLRENKWRDTLAVQAQHRGFEAPPLSIGAAGAMLLVTADKQMPAGLTASNDTLQKELTSSEHLYQVTQERYPLEMRKLIRHWLNRPTQIEDEDEIISGWGLFANVWHKSMLLDRYALNEEGVELATFWLKKQAQETSHDQIWIMIESFALNAAASFGDRSSLELIQLIEPLLEDHTPISSGAVRVELRDLALVTLIEMTGQKPQDYKLYRVRRDAYFLNSINAESLVFESPAEREEAFALWKAWSKANLSESKSEKAPAKR